MKKNNDKRIIITGAAGFVGFHLSQRLLNDGWFVIGIDNFSDYYDISLKKNREKILLKSKNYQSINKNIEDPGMLADLFIKIKPNVVIHLAAQAGVRYSIDNPRAYLESNIVGSFELLEAVRKSLPEHVLLASTSSAYGANKTMPYKETDIADHQMSFYAATKKSNENMAHSYSHLFKIPITVFRFFTVYGPWGRPDMAYFLFTDAIVNNRPIKVFNNGKLSRDFTYIDDVVNGVAKTLIEDSKNKDLYKLYNIGNSNPVNLLKFINTIEDIIGLKSIKKMLPMQAGDVNNTFANTKNLEQDYNYKSKNNIKYGIEKFVSWYKFFYKL